MDISMKDSIGIMQTFVKEVEKLEPDLGTALTTAALNMAIMAMEKQVELEATEHDGMFIVCPSCKAKVLPSEFCAKCGQALMEVKKKTQ